MSNITEKDNLYIAKTYNRFPVELVSGKGALLYSADGKEYIDMGSGIGVSTFGACDSVWQQAVSKQAETLSHVSNLYYTKPCTDLAELLIKKTNLKRVFFANSGAEANECAIKVARKYAEDKGVKDANIITLVNSFHGRTITTLSATGQDKFHENFMPLTSGFLYAPANDLDAVNRLIAEYSVSAIMIELIQGEGGVIPLDYGFVKGLYNLCNDKDILLIVDEVQTGNGRTGALYAYQNYDILPDVVTTAKGLGGGLPIGACMLGEKVENTFTFGTHGSTFGGNPVCSAGAISIIERLTPELLNSVKEKGEYITNALKDIKGVVSVTGMGLMIGVKTVKPVKEVVSYCIENGVLPLTAKDKLRLLPPLNITYEQLNKALTVIKNAIK